MGRSATKAQVPGFRPLDGLVVHSAPGPSPALDVCRRHLSLLGAVDGPAPGGGSDVGGYRRRETGRLRVESGGRAATSGAALVVSVGHEPSAADIPALDTDETVVQAVCGLMAVHGREGGRPRRIGLDVASVGAGVVAAQGVLAALIGRLRGHRIAGVQTSALRAALVFVSHHLAAATCGDPWSPGPGGPAPGPPFLTADGHRLELEVLTPEAWRTFWVSLGMPTAALDRAWLVFAFRHDTAFCHLPPGMHEAVARCSLAEVRAAAEAAGVAVCRLRNYAEVLAAGEATCPAPPRAPWAPWAITPRGVGAPARLDAGTGSSGPLEGVQVVEATSRIQGPLAGLLLSMLGASVVKVEPPGGDAARLVPPAAGSRGVAFLAYNHGKSSVEIDYKTPAGRRALLELAAGADVFLHNWPAGRAQDLELDEAVLGVVNPRLVYAHASGWGGGLGLPHIGTDRLVQAHAGYGDGLNPEGEPPSPSPLTLVDAAGGLVACEAVLAALLLRELTGRASGVQTSLVSSAMALQAPVLEAMAAGREHRRRAGRPLWGVLDRPLETAEGFLVVGTVDDGALPELRHLLGVEPGDPDRRVAEALRIRSAGHWEHRLNRAGIAAAAVTEELGRLPGDPRIAPLLDHVDGACWVPGAPWRFEP